MRTKLYHKLTAAVCALALLLSLTPAAYAAYGSNGAAYSKRGSYLLPRADGGYDLVWASGHQYGSNLDGSLLASRGQAKITTYDANFHEVSSRPLTFELSTLRCAYYGEKYNYIVFTQNNDEETDGKEVLRLVKYSRDWQRLGAASLYGKASNTTDAGRGGNFSFAEAGDMLYIHTAHKMYHSEKDGVQHQANMTFSVRQSDMTVKYGIGTAYVSHSFDQDILIDQAANIVTLDRGDGYPRGALLYRCPTTADGNLTTPETRVILKEWPGDIGNNETGSATCGLAETSQGYLSLYWDSERGQNIGVHPSNLYLAFNPKNDMTRTQTRTVYVGTELTDNIKCARIFPTSSEGGYILWFNSNIKTKGLMGHCAMYAADGTVGQTTDLGIVPEPISGPCYDGKRIVWSSLPVSDNGDGMQFGVLEGTSYRTVNADGELAGTQAPAPATPAAPTTSVSFTDVSASHWAYNDIMACAQAGAVNGVGNGKFDPEGQVTDLQLVVMLTRAFFNHRLEKLQDVVSSDWYAPNMRVASDVGMIETVTIENKPANRYIMAELLAQTALGRSKTCTLQEKDRANAELKDWGSIPNQHQEAIRLCYGLGIIGGMSDGCFHGEQTMTRAQACAVIQRLSKLING